MPTVLVVTGPSGAGKGTLIRELVDRVPGIEVTVSATTRERRRGEEDGREYWFLSDDVSTKCTIRVRKKGITSLRITMRELDSGDDGETIALHPGAQSIELPSRCTEVDVTVTGPRGATAVLLLESR